MSASAGVVQQLNAAQAEKKGNAELNNIANVNIGMTFAYAMQRVPNILGKWELFLKKLKGIEGEVERKTKEGYALQNRIPTQVELLTLSEECLSLSEAWHGQGKGNLSCFYQFFQRICETAQITFYKYSDLSMLKSKDGFASLLELDVEKRNKLQKTYSDAVQGPYLRQGGLWKGGRSAIDNSILSNVMLKEDPTIIAAGLRRVMVGYIKKKQRAIIETLRKNTPEHTKFSDFELVKTHFQCSIANKKINKEGLPFQLLLKTGKLLEDWGQVPQSCKEALYKLAVDRTIAQVSSNANSAPKLLFNTFVKFVKDNPGVFIDSKAFNWDELFSGSDKTGALAAFKKLSPKQLHWLIYSVGLWSGQLSISTRARIENDSPIHYIPFSWIRKFNLENIMDGKKAIVRFGKSKETSMIRVNQGAYQPYHGLSMSTSGLVEGLKNHNTLLYKLGIPVDPTATISNMHCDIEKILREVVFLNPQTSIDKCLPGEAYMTVGQNSVAGSSIKATQHTQIYAGHLKDFPVFDQLKAKSTVSTTVEAKVEFVQVGNKPDAFYLKLTTHNPIADNFIKCLIELKMSLLEKFGGIEKIDFILQATPDGAGNFVVIFAPHARLEMRNQNVYYNPESDENNVALQLPAEHLHLANATGHWGLDFNQDKAILEATLQDGRSMLAHVWDFASKVGTYQHSLQYLQDNFGVKSSAKIC